ncbi:uncharacterized protein [Clytia hemisphaerica]|uniref:Uncharacterized protein n=1 Tax=Clytia hemisphaerica TaxID=252671 RepID=A0A7M5XN35_9CNID
MAKASADKDFDHLYKLVLVGDSGTGKTGLVSRFARDESNVNKQSTIGIDFKIRSIKAAGKTIKTQIWDTAGGERFRTITKAYYRGAVGVFIVYNVSVQKTFENVQRWLDDVREYSGPEVVLMLVGNKTVVEDSAAKEGSVNTKEAQEFAKQNHLMFMETSTLDGSNVELAFISMVQKIYEKQNKLEKDDEVELFQAPENLEDQRGYEFDTVGDSRRRGHECAFCNMIIKQFTELPCGHGFCGSCLETWELKEDEGKNPISCILCKKEYDVTKKQTSNFIDRQITADLEVYCKKKDEGCKWSSFIVDFEGHYKNECQFAIIQCVFDGCELYFKRKDKAIHNKNCVKRIVQCPHCKQDFQFFKLNNPHFGECDQFPVDCLNEGCEVNLPRIEMKNKHGPACKWERVGCQFEDFGCQTKLLRSEEVKHNNEFNIQHTMLLMAKQRETLNDLQTTKNDLQTTKNELQTTTTDLQTTKNDLQTTKNELLESKKSLEEQKNLNKEIVNNINRLHVANSSVESLLSLLVNGDIPRAHTKPIVYDGVEFCSSLGNHQQMMNTILSKMEFGKTYKTDLGKRLFFTFRMIHDVTLYFQLYNNYDLASTRESYRKQNMLVDGRDQLILVYFDKNRGDQYQVWMNNRDFTKTNSSVFLHNMKKNGDRRQIRYHVLENIAWDDYRNEDKYVLFELMKK